MFKLIKEGNLTFPEKPVTSDAAKDFIVRCLNRVPEQRLGAQGDVREILGHPFFKDIDLNLLEKKEITPPFTPDKDWKKYFDDKIIKMNPPSSFESSGQTDNDDPFNKYF